MARSDDAAARDIAQGMPVAAGRTVDVVPAEPLAVTPMDDRTAAAVAFGAMGLFLFNAVFGALAVGLGVAALVLIITFGSFVAAGLPLLNPGIGAGVPTRPVPGARPVGALRYLCERSEGLRNDVVFAFDLPLPTEFVPTPNDDEVESFALWPMGRVLERIRDSDDFKFNVALVNLDFALRHGALTPDAEPAYQQITEGLQGRFAD